MKIKPLFDRVLIKRKVNTNLTKSGITLTQNDEGEATLQGIVVAVGKGDFEGEVFVKMQVEVGDTILFEPHLTAKFEQLGEQLFLIRQADILAIIEGE